MSDRLASLLTQYGVHVAPEWSDEVGLSRAAADAVIHELAKNGRPLLGGDVYHRNHGRIVTAHANWSCSRTADERFVNYVERSLTLGLQYIAQYPEPDGGADALFVLVIG